MRMSILYNILMLTIGSFCFMIFFILAEGYMIKELSANRG